MKSANGFIIIEDIQLDETRASGYQMDNEEDYSNYKIMSMAKARVLSSSHDTVMLNKEEGYATPLCKKGDIIYFDSNQLIKFSLKGKEIIRGTFHKFVLAIETPEDNMLYTNKKTKE